MPDLQKSPIYDIKKTALTFYIKPDKKFIDLFNRGASVNFAIVILPLGLDATSFSTMRQAKAAGAKNISGWYARNDNSTTSRKSKPRNQP
jgi:hypothetical protein